MGDFLVTKESANDEGDGRYNRPSSVFRYNEIFERECSHYLSMGMSYHDYWDGDSAMTKFYRDKYKHDVEHENFNNWMQGAYFYEALCKASPLFNALAKNHEPIPYRSEPIPITTSAVKHEKEQQNKQKMENSKNAMKVIMEDINRRFAEKGGVEDER